MVPSGCRSSILQAKPEAGASPSADTSATKMEGATTSTDFHRSPLRQSLRLTRCVLPPTSVHSLNTCAPTPG